MHSCTSFPKLCVPTSFLSCRSLGLTILAVAKGRFPLSGKDSSGNDDSLSDSSSSPLHQAVVGGAAGYWAMIKAICDDEPPVAGPFFSAEFNSFIAACLQKDPADRSTAKDLLSLPFILNNSSSLKLSYSDLQMRNAKGSPEHNETKAPSPAKRLLEVDTSHSPDSPTDSQPAPSPLTTRLTNAAIVRRTSHDVPVFDSPTNLMHKAITEAAEQKASLESNSAKEANGSGNALHVSSTIREDAEEEEIQFIDGAQRALDVINSIRLEHLDRVLDRIAHKLGSSLRERGASLDEEDDGYDDTQDRDLTDIHHFDHENHFTGVKDDVLIQAHDSIDSIDKLLQHKASESSPTAPPVLQLPARFAKKAVAAEPAPEVDEIADSKPLAHSMTEAKAHKGDKHSIDEDAKVREENKQAIHVVEEKASAQHHSILKVILLPSVSQTMILLLISYIHPGYRILQCHPQHPPATARRSGQHPRGQPSVDGRRADEGGGQEGDLREPQSALERYYRLQLQPVRALQRGRRRPPCGPQEGRPLPPT